MGTPKRARKHLRDRVSKMPKVAVPKPVAPTGIIKKWEAIAEQDQGVPIDELRKHTLVCSCGIALVLKTIDTTNCGNSKCKHSRGLREKLQKMGTKQKQKKIFLLSFVLARREVWIRRNIEVHVTRVVAEYIEDLLEGGVKNNTFEPHVDELVKILQTESNKLKKNPKNGDRRKELMRFFAKTGYFDKYRDEVEFRDRWRYETSTQRHVPMLNIPSEDAKSLSDGVEALRRDIAHVLPGRPSNPTNPQVLHSSSDNDKKVEEDNSSNSMISSDPDTEEEDEEEGEEEDDKKVEEEDDKKVEEDNSSNSLISSDPDTEEKVEENEFSSDGLHPFGVPSHPCFDSERDLKDPSPSERRNLKRNRDFERICQNCFF